MAQWLSRIRICLTFYRQAVTKFRVHSPRIFDFVSNVLEDQRQYYAFSAIESVRKTLLANKSRIELQDLGAGSIKMSPGRHTVAGIARHSATSARNGQLLFRIANHYQPETILELGTSFGLSTLYLAKGARQADLHTLEGSVQVARYAKSHFQSLQTPNVHLHEGPFDTQLPKVLAGLERIDLLFLDGNHRYHPTLDYFNRCLPLLHEQSIFVLDDIHWSEEMYQAWQDLIAHPSVTQSIELASFGILLFDTAFRSRHNWCLVPYLWKPWQVM